MFNFFHDKREFYNCLKLLHHKRRILKRIIKHWMQMKDQGKVASAMIAKELKHL